MGKPTKHRGVLPKNAPAGTIVERTIINRGNRRKIKWKRTRLARNYKQHAKRDYQLSKANQDKTDFFD